METQIRFAKDLQKQVAQLMKSKEAAENVLRTMQGVINTMPKEQQAVMQETQAKVNHIIETAKNGGDYQELFKKYTQENNK